MSTVKHDNPVKIQGVTRGVCYAYLKFDDLSDADTSEDITWAALVTAHPDGASNPPANSRIVYAHANLIAEFNDGVAATISAVTLSLGDAGAATEQINAIDIFTGAGTGLKAKNGSYAGTAIEAAYTPIVRIATTDANIDTLTAGAVELALHYETIDSARVVRIAG